MTLVSGARLGPYEIAGPLGKGGMGEVYRARDTRLGRDVAIKILPELFAADPERLQRFEREARTLASLNHPQIAQIHGVEESPAGSGGTVRRALVMELVEGHDLAAVIARGPLPVPEALGIAKQMADALAAAHERGIVHRDLKPSNVMVREDGTVKLLDFGLAKLASDDLPSGTGGVGMNSPTITSPATQIGVILGTAAYMAPEQAKGRPVDRRADVWAFGAVLFEMLTGRRAFEGEDISDTLAFIITREPDWEALPPATPASIRRLLRRCLEKDRAKRLDSLGAARLDIEEALASPAPGVAPPPATPSRSTRPLPLVATALAAASVGAAGMWAWTRPSTPLPGPVLHLQTTPPAPDRLYLDGQTADFDISPEGTHIAYLAYRGTAIYPELFIRRFDQARPTLVPGTANAQHPFFSADGGWIAFGQDNALKKVSVHGGAPQTVCLQCTQGFRGGAFMEDGSILVADVGGTVGIRRFPADGADPERITRVDPQAGERGHTFPYQLPGTRAILYSIGSGGVDRILAVQDLDDGTKKRLFDGVRPRYLPTGHLLYASEGTLFAVRFDLARLEAVGDPVAVLEDVLTKAEGTADYAIGPGGALVYTPGGVLQSHYAVMIGSRTGPLREAALPKGTYIMARFSPDGKSAAIDARTGNYDIWLWDLGTKLDRMTFGPQMETYPVWSPDGRQVYFLQRGTDSTTGTLYRHNADLSGTPVRIAEMPGPLLPTTITPDGKAIVAQLAAPSKTHQPGLYVVLLEGDHTPTRIEGVAPGAMNADISPDGRWLAYQAGDSLRTAPEVFVQPFPDVAGGRRQVSPDGGTHPLWSRRTNELFYRNAQRQIVSVAMLSLSPLTPGAPTVVRDHHFVPGPARAFDFSADGQTILMIDEMRSDIAEAPQLHVLLNWVEELKRRVPAGR